MKRGRTKVVLMKIKLITPIVVVVFAAACGGDGASAEKGAGRNYETVQEGSASGVTSTIAGPGDTLPPITGTNADTTTAFTLDPNVGAGAVPSQPASMAGTMPAPTPAYNPGFTPSAAPRSASSSSSAAPQRPAYVPQPMTSASSAPRPQPQYQQQSQPQQPQQPQQAQQAQQAQQPQPAQPSEEPAAEETTAQGPASDGDSAAPLPAPTQTAPPAQQQKPPQQEQEEPAEDEGEAAEEEPPPPPPPAR
jgi:hypothetical protein